MKRARTSTLWFGLALCVIGLAFAEPQTAHADADSEQALMDQKTAWQDNYRLLLRDAALLEQDAKTSRENYARARRRNYPRGGARQQYILNAEAAEKKLVQVKQEIEVVTTDARRDAIPPNWRYEVEDEPISLSPPASASTETDGGDDDWDSDDAGNDSWTDEAADEEAKDQAYDREGRNPLYRDN